MRAQLLALVLLAGAARAEEKQPCPAIPQGPAPHMTSEHWEHDRPRFFFATRADLGFLYVRPRLSFGYGKPFAAWTGLDVVPSITPDSTNGYGGLRLQIEWFELRAGLRFVHRFARQYLTPRPSYDLVHLAEDSGRPAQYMSLEAEASAAIPLGPGNIIALLTAESVQFVPPNTYVFDEALRVVISPPQVYRARAGYAFVLGREKTGRLGALVEGIHVPDRRAQVFRAGLTGAFDVDDHLQFVATVMVPFYSPDTLGLLGADFTELGVRFRWATAHHDLPDERIHAPP